MKALDDLLRKKYSPARQDIPPIAESAEEPESSDVAIQTPHPPTPEAPPFESESPSYVSSPHFRPPYASAAPTKNHLDASPERSPQGNVQSPPSDSVVSQASAELRFDNAEKLSNASTDGQQANEPMPVASDDSSYEDAVGELREESIEEPTDDESDPIRIVREFLTNGLPAAEPTNDSHENLQASQHSEVESVPPTPFRPEWEIDVFPWPRICDDMQDRIGQEINALIPSLKSQCVERDTKVVLLTSANSGTGRTTLSLCLAHAASMLGEQVAIVELEHARPTMLQQVGIDFEVGVESLGRDDITAEGICVAALEEGVALFPAATAFEPSLTQDQAVQDMLRTATQNYDLVFVDASREVVDQLLQNRDWRNVAVLMMETSESHAATDAFLEWLEEKQVQPVGVIENFAA